MLIEILIQYVTVTNELLKFFFQIACEKCTKTFHRTEACIGLEHMSRGYFICKMCLTKDIHVVCDLAILK